jgi:hypothetical protein
MTESISAWNEAHMMFSDTPTVHQRTPLESVDSIRTRQDIAAYSSVEVATGDVIE